MVPLGLGGHPIEETLGVPGFTSLPYGKTLGLGDWVWPHLILGQPLPSLDLSSQRCLGD